MDCRCFRRGLWFGFGHGCSPTLWFVEEDVQPVACEREAFRVQAIGTRAALALVTNDVARFQHLKMARGCGPSVIEDVRDLARRHGTTLEEERVQNAAACGMRQSDEESFVSIGRPLRFPFRHATIFSDIA